MRWIKKEIPMSMITKAQFGLKNCVVRMTSATCVTKINLKLSTSPSDILFNQLLQKMVREPLEHNDSKIEEHV